MKTVAAIAREQHVAKLLGAREAAHMGGENVIAAVAHSVCFSVASGSLWARGDVTSPTAHRVQSECALGV